MGYLFTKCYPIVLNISAYTIYVSTNVHINMRTVRSNILNILKFHFAVSLNFEISVVNCQNAMILVLYILDLDLRSASTN